MPVASSEMFITADYLGLVFYAATTTIKWSI